MTTARTKGRNYGQRILNAENMRKKPQAEDQNQHKETKDLRNRSSSLNASGARYEAIMQSALKRDRNAAIGNREVD